jgi:hypothetical protein
MSFWNWLLWILTLLSADPKAADTASARAAAAVSAARASMRTEPAPAPAPKAPTKPAAACVNGRCPV